MGLYHGWDHDPDKHADFVRGGVAPEDFDDAPTKRRKKTGKKSPKKKRGCPENDFGPHVYVWVPSPQIYDWWPECTDDFFERHGFHRREYKTCCGCEKKFGSRYTEEMRKLINKKGWYEANYGD